MSEELALATFVLVVQAVRARILTQRARIPPLLNRGEEFIRSLNYHVTVAVETTIWHTKLRLAELRLRIYAGFKQRL